MIKCLVCIVSAGHGLEYLLHITEQHEPVNDKVNNNSCARLLNSFLQTNSLTLRLAKSI